jgi:hypothetical protein
VTNWPNQLENEGGFGPLTSLYSVPGYTQFQCDIADIEYGPDKDAQKDPSLVKAIHNKIDAEGLRWPIILKSGNKSLYRCYIGNNRVAYAHERGYDSITAIVVDNSHDKLHIMQYCKRIDEHGFDSE